MKSLTLWSLVIAPFVSEFASVATAADQPAAQATPSAQTPPPASPKPANKKASPPPQPIPVPFVTAKTNMVSSKTVNEPTLNFGGLTLTQAQTQRELSVTASVQFFSPLPGPFDVQCFFMAKNDTTKSRYIFNVVQAESPKQTFSDEIHSGTLLATTRTWVGIPFALPGSVPPDGGNVVDITGKNVTSDTKSASKIEGWILRVVYQGRVLKVDANQSNLAELANRLPKVFDEAAKEK